MWLFLFFESERHHYLLSWLMVLFFLKITIDNLVYWV
jgi:hypothetical protein